MLKIRDDADLKELEKFGFKLDKNQHIGDSYLLNYEFYLIGVCAKNREIWIEDNNALHIYEKEALDILFDIIQANLVEKI